MFNDKEIRRKGRVHKDMDERMVTNMAISVRDIQEKEFSTQLSGGYNIEQVDDFLDEIVEQLSKLVRENLELNEQVRLLDTELEAAKKAAADAEARVPDYNEKGYFDNLNNAMRETLIGAKRIADETIEEANQKAAKLVGDAQAEADKLAIDSKAAADKLAADSKAAADKLAADSMAKAEFLVSNAQAEADRIAGAAKSEIEALEARIAALKASAKAFKADFTKLLDAQAAVLRDNANMF